MKTQSNSAEVKQAIQDAQQAVREAAQDARQAAQDARQAAQEGADARARGEGRPIVISQDKGESVTIDMKDGNLVITQDGNTKVIPWRDAVPKGAVQIAWAIPATLSILLIWWPLTRAVTGWLRRKSAVSSDNGALERRLQERFETMERNIDTVAIEMERLAEGQRFTSRIIAERQTGVPPVAVPVNVPVNVPVGASRP
jgi:hypothetical protein